MNGLKSLYLSVATQRIGIARLPDEITDSYIDAFLANATRHGIGFVALDGNGEVIGDIHAEYLQVYIFRNVLSNLTIAVHPEHQGQGIGKQLFQRFIAEARRNKNLERIELFCKERNHSAVKMYESLGFKVEGILRNRTNLDGVPENDLVMGYVL
ncbi:MAG: GNAT family N-acetyltransferase [Spirochaetia bacterium]|nr:GNAT family N-acetyltransferase [Spirochaetia bacterium]